MDAAAPGVHGPLRAKSEELAVELTRREQLIAEVSERLRRVCPHMTDEEFHAFAEDVARVTEKYERSATPTGVEKLSPSHRRRGD